MNRFEVRSLLGQGGISAVYLCDDEETSERLAVKILRPSKEILTEEAIISTRKEAATLSRIRHRNIVRVYDVLQDHIATYFLLEFVEGQTLCKDPAALPYSIDDFIAIAHQCLEGLAAAHRSGLLHLDIKPENIMTYEDAAGRLNVKILDFGISQMASDMQEQRDEDEVMGSIFYISPEQIEQSALTPATDLYSLGQVFYHMMAGKLAFEGVDPIEVARSRLREENPDIRYYNPECPDELAYWIHQLIRRIPEERPQACQDAIIELTSLSMSRNRIPELEGDEDEAEKKKRDNIARKISRSIKSILPGFKKGRNQGRR